MMVNHSDLIDKFTAYHAIRPMANLRQSLSSLDDKLDKLFERAQRNSVSDTASTSSSDRGKDELLIDTLKTRTDDLSKISVSVLKYYSDKENDLDPAERRFYERYVKPVKPYL